MNKLVPKWWNSKAIATSPLDHRYALLEACTIGFFSGLAALVLKRGVGIFGDYRIALASLFGTKLVLPIIGLILGFFAGALLELLSPAAAGGGIPQVKAVLARYPLRLNLKIALVKTLGTILVLGSGLTLGRRGPTVHIGAAIAAQVSSWLPNSPTNRRQTIAAGAAAGLAAGFNTPIAGVLFVVEELMRDASGLTLETAIAASFTGALVSRLFDPDGGAFPAILQNVSSRGNFALAEIPFYLMLGILAGVLGGVFNRGVIWGVSWNRRLPISMPIRIGLAGLVSGAVIAFLPDFFLDNEGLRDILVSGELSWQMIAIAFIIHFFLTIIAYSSGAPGGLFAPALVLGSALGYLVGTAEFGLIGSESPYTFALAGMGAFFTSVVRVPVTAILIVFEMTADFSLVLPLMISCAVAYLTAESLSKGSLYEHLLHASGIEVNDDHPTSDFLSQLTAFDVMEAEVETLDSDISIAETIAAMSDSHHRGFPVVEQEKLVGIITQSDVADLRTNKPVGYLADIMTKKPMTVRPQTSLADVLYLLNRYQLSRLPVTEGNILRGIITRSDIIKAEAQQLIGDREVIDKFDPSYINYQTRSPAIGKGRILLTISNPNHARSLMEIALAIAKSKKYEIQCLQIISVPKYVYPSQAKVDTADARHLMHRLERLGRKAQVSIHTQVKIANSIPSAIIETIQQEQIRLLITGWSGTNLSPENIFGNIVDTLIEKVTCDLIMIKLGAKANCFPYDSSLATSNKKPRKWLIPTAGGENTFKLIEFLPGLVSLDRTKNSPEINLCNVFRSFQHESSFRNLKNLSKEIISKTGLPTAILSIRDNSVADAVMKLHKNHQYDFIILGGRHDDLLKNIVMGNISKEIMRQVPTTIMIFRSSQ